MGDIIEFKPKEKEEEIKYLQEGEQIMVCPDCDEEQLLVTSKFEVYCSECWQCVVEPIEIDEEDMELIFNFDEDILDDTDS